MGRVTRRLGTGGTAARDGWHGGSGGTAARVGWHGGSGRVARRLVTGGTVARDGWHGGSGRVARRLGGWLNVVALRGFEEPHDQQACNLHEREGNCNVHSALVAEMKLRSRNAVSIPDAPFWNATEDLDLLEGQRNHRHIPPRLNLSGHWSWDWKCDFVGSLRKYLGSILRISRWCPAYKARTFFKIISPAFSRPPFPRLIPKRRNKGIR